MKYARFVLLVLLLGSRQAYSHAGGECLSYEPAVVTLTGTIVRQTFPGPPNYESIQSGDRAETYWLLELPQAVCVDSGVAGALEDEPKQGIQRIQLVFSDGKAYSGYRKLLKKRVVATGTLFGSFNIHHRTPVLLFVKTLAAAPRSNQQIAISK